MVKENLKKRYVVFPVQKVKERYNKNLFGTFFTKIFFDNQICYKCSLPFNEHKGFNSFVHYYFQKKMEKCVKLSDFKPTDIILDFGCGTKRLAKYLHILEPSLKVLNYDVTEDTELDDYTKTLPTIIFALDVFEHLTLEEFYKTLLNFKCMNKNMKIVISIPTETFFQQVLRVLVGKGPRCQFHIINLKQILSVLKEHGKFIDEKSFLSFSKIVVFQFN